MPSNMDYKTNVLTEELKTDVDLLPELSGLHFGIVGESRALFDYTAYLEENNIQPIDYRIFMRVCKPFIEALAKNAGKKTSELFFQNTNGHILIAAELAFICTAFVNPEMCVYFNSLLTDAISDGVAYSHGFMYSMAAERIPSEVLGDIIKERQNDNSGDEQ